MALHQIFNYAIDPLYFSFILISKIEGFLRSIELYNHALPVLDLFWIYSRLSLSYQFQHHNQGVWDWPRAIGCGGNLSGSHPHRRSDWSHLFHRHPRPSFQKVIHSWCRQCVLLANTMGAILCVLSIVPNYQLFFFVRLLQGFTSGFISAVIPLIVRESTPH